MQPGQIIFTAIVKGISDPLTWDAGDVTWDTSQVRWNDSMMPGTQDVFPNQAPDWADIAESTYAVYTSITRTPENTLSNGSTAENERYQVDIYAPGYQQVQMLADGVKAAMLAIPWPYAVAMLMQADEYEADVKLFRVIQEYSIWQPRSI